MVNIGRKDWYWRRGTGCLADIFTICFKQILAIRRRF